MKQIIITSPEKFSGEDKYIPTLIERGANTVGIENFAIHLRKPSWTITQYAALLKKIPSQYHPNIVLHDYFSLCRDFDLRGIHLNRRNTSPPHDHHGSISCSCHSFNEVINAKPTMDYVFLSPVFDCISKSGYNAGFTPEQLTEASVRGIIDHKVIALGGITQARIPQIIEWHFGGYAQLGDIWNNINYHLN